MLCETKSNAENVDKKENEDGFQTPEDQAVRPDYTPSELLGLATRQAENKRKTIEKLDVRTVD